MGCAQATGGKGFILCLCGAFSAPSLRRSGPLLPLTLDGTSFNIQNPIPHPSQKEKVLLETSRAKECQRGIAGAAERAKEGDRVPSESSDTRLGARCREFESPHSGQLRLLKKMQPLKPLLRQGFQPFQRTKSSTRRDGDAKGHFRDVG